MTSVPLRLQVSVKTWGPEARRAAAAARRAHPLARVTHGPGGAVHVTHPNGTLIKFTPYTGGEPPSVRDLIRGRRLKDVPHNDMAYLSQVIREAATRAMTHKDANSASADAVDQYLLLRLTQLAASNSDFNFLDLVHEAQAKLAQVQEEKSGVTGVENSAMVALYPHPDVAKKLAVPGGEDPGHMHITVAFLGKGLSDDDMDKATEAVSSAVKAGDVSVLKGQLGGLGRFPVSPDGEPVFAPVDVPGLAELHTHVKSALEDAGIPQASDHGYTPHLTLTYRQPGEPVPRPVKAVPVSFDHVRIVRGNQEHARVELGGAEAKSAEGAETKLASFNPNLHPRDRNGRFASIGATVRDSEGKTGTIVGHNPDGTVRVKVDGGGTSTVNPKALTVTQMNKPGQAKPGAYGGYGLTQATRERRGDGRVPMKPRAGTKYTEGDPRNDPEYEEHYNKLTARIKAAEAAGQDTESLFKKDGQWTPERDDLHTQILNDIMASAKNVPSEKKAIVLGGPPGSGKSTWVKKFGSQHGIESNKDGDPTNFIVINPDEMKQVLLDAHNKDGSPATPLPEGLSAAESASLVHEESSYLANMLAQLAIAQHKNIVFDITIGSADSTKRKFLTPAKQEGYDLTAQFIDGSIPMSLHRVGVRHKKPDKETGVRGYNGRSVPLGHVADLANTEGKKASDGSIAKSKNRLEYDKLIADGTFDHAHRFDNETEKSHVDKKYDMGGLEYKHQDWLAGSIQDPGLLRAHMAEIHPDVTITAPSRGSLRWSALAEQKALLDAHLKAHDMVIL